MDDSENQNELPDLEQLVDLFVYAPIGLLYEYQTVLPQLIKRGRSQVQLARVLGQFAAKQGSRQMNKQSTQAADTAMGVLSTVLTEFGSSIGLAPPSSSASPTTAEGDGSGAAPSDSEAPSTEKPDPPDPEAADGGPAPAGGVPLPIAGYDDLNARSIIELLGDLTNPQLARVRTYESDNRNRKTVLAKIDRLLA